MYQVCLFIFFLASSLSVGGQSYIDLSNKIGQLFADGKYAEAIPLALAAKAATQKEFRDTFNIYANCLNNLAGLYMNIGNYAAAALLLKEALAIRTQILGEDHPDYAQSLNNLAELYTETANYIAAESLFKQALTIRKKVLGEEHSYYASSLNNLAALYRRTGNYATAEPLYRLALDIYKKNFGKKHPAYATTLVNLAYLFQSMGNYIASESLYEQASTVFKLLGNEHPNYALSLNNHATLYQSLGKYAAAETLFIQALAIRKKVLGEEHIDYAQSINNLANLYVGMRNYTAADSLYKLALAIIKKVLGKEHPTYAGCLNNQARLYESMGDNAGAEFLFKLALNIRKKALGEEHSDYAQSLNDLATLYESIGNYSLAAKYLISGTNLTFRHIKSNINNLSEAEKLIWWENVEDEFQIAPSLLITNPIMSATFFRQVCTQQLQLKGFVLNDGAKVLQQARKKGSLQLQHLLNQWQTNKATLAKQYSLPIAKRIQELESLEKQTNEQEKEINRQSAIFRTSQENLQIGFKEVRQQLKQDEAAVEFMRFNYFHKGWTDSILYAAFIILPNNSIPHFVTLCEEKQLAGLLESKTNSKEYFVTQLYRGVIISNSQQADGKKGDSLFNLVWKPLLPWLKGVRKISIAPTGLLNRIAFNALPGDRSTYLIAKYQIRQYSSVRQIAEQKIPLSETSGATHAVLFGGIEFNVADTSTTPSSETVANTLPDDIIPSISGGVWHSLPATLEEVNKISQLFKINNKTIRVITGAAATEESLKQLSGHSPVILHLATHGFSLPDAEQKRKEYLHNNENQFTLADNPLLRSGIIMAGANRVWGGAAPVGGKEDGIVTAYEISNLDLSNTELVVLSACETALGDIKGTEGVFGLQRAFKSAGVQNMILSLWQVPDTETAELMSLLYSNKFKGMNSYEAFNKAQDSMRKKYPPYYWAAFVLLE